MVEQLIPSKEKTDAAKPSSAPSPTYFENKIIDSLMTITLELGSALWVTKDRLRVMEALLAEHGIVTAEKINQYQSPPEAAAEALAERTLFIERIYGTLKDL